jgi:hypothetical protein
LEGRGCDDTAWPFIEYSQLLTANKENLLPPTRELIEVLADDGFGIEWDDGTLKLQLPKDYHMKPKHCQLEDDFKALIQWFGSMLWNLLWNFAIFAIVGLRWALGFLYTWATESPAHLLGFLGVVAVLVWRWNRNTNQKKRRDVLDGTNLALDKLRKNSGKAIKIDSVRDEVANELFPKHPKKQRDWKKTTWLDVKQQVGKANGVQRTHIATSGKPIPAWKSTRQTTFVN